MNVFPSGSLVRILNYGPFRGLRGNVRRVHTISTDVDEPFCFYLIALEGAQMKEPLWFEYDEIELVATPLVAVLESN
jgi:hypothetical protein